MNMNEILTPTDGGGGRRGDRSTEVDGLTAGRAADIPTDVGPLHCRARTGSPADQHSAH